MAIISEMKGRKGTKGGEGGLNIRSANQVKILISFGMLSRGCPLVLYPEELKISVNIIMLSFLRSLLGSSLIVSMEGVTSLN